MDITKNTPFDEISKAFNFKGWVWDPDDSKTIRQICIESAAIAARDILTNQDLVITDAGIQIDTYLDGPDVVSTLIPWPHLIKGYDAEYAEYVANMLENAARALRKLNEPSPRPQQAQAGQ